MSYAAVRAATVAWFNTAGIEGLQKVYQDMPWFLDAAEWNVTPGRPWGAVGFIHLDSSNESRITVGAENPTLPADAVGYKQVEYVLSLGLQYQYLIPATLPADVAADVWVEGLDSLIDAVKARIRQDPLLGATSDVIFQAGQDDNDIRVESDLPIYDAGVRVYSFHRVQFNLTEIINA